MTMNITMPPISSSIKGWNSATKVVTTRST